MSNRWMITAAAAALIAGSGFAYAQGNMGHEGGAAGGSAGTHQGATPSPSAGGAGHEGAAGMKSGQAEQKSGATNRSAQQENKGAERRTVGQSTAGEKSTGDKSAQENGKSERSKSMSSQNEEKGATGKKAEERNERNGNMKAEERNEHNGNMKAEGQERNGNMKAEGQERNGNARNGNATAESSRAQTTGQAGAGAKLSTEQRTKITTVIRGEHVAPVNNVNFDVSVGTRVPRGEISFHPLPSEIVTIYPEWRGYEFFLARDEIIVVDPRTLEIVAVLPA